MEIGPEIALIAESVSCTEPDGAHLVDLARALLRSATRTLASPYTTCATSL